MIRITKTYNLALTEQQTKELYEFLKIQKDVGHLTHDYELFLVYNELKRLFDTGIR